MTNQPRHSEGLSQSPFPRIQTPVHKVGLFSFQISIAVLTKPFGSELGGSNSTIRNFAVEKKKKKRTC